MIDSALTALGKLITAPMPFTVLDQYEQGVLLRFGKFKKIVGPGFHWYIPLVDRVLRDNIVVEGFESDIQDLTTADGKQISIIVTFSLTILDIHAVLIDIENWQHTTLIWIAGLIGEHVRMYDWDEIKNQGFTDILYDECKAFLDEKGIGISEFRIKNLTDAIPIRLITN